MTLSTWIYLIRHGETDSNADRRLQGHLDIPLNDRGREQARGIGKWMEELHPAAIYTSDLQRAAESARIAAGPVREIRLEPAIRERCFGAWQGLTVEEIEDRYPELYRCWRRRDPGFCPPGGETYYQLLERTAGVLERVSQRHEGESVALFSHGGTINAAIKYALADKSDSSLPVIYANGSISAVRIEAGAWTVARLNDTCHLSRVGHLPDIRSHREDTPGDQGLPLEKE